MVEIPELPEPFRDRGWREAFRESNLELDLRIFSIVSHNVVYEAPGAEALRGLVAVDADAGPRSAFATALEFDPPLPKLGIDPASVFGHARRHASKEFARSVREDGLLDVRQTDARWIERDDGTRARAFRYETGTPIDRDRVFGDRAGEVPRPFVLRGRLWAAIWPTAEAYSMAGGLYPVETVAEAAARQAPEVPVVGEFDVEIDPGKHRRELARLIQSIGIPEA